MKHSTESEIEPIAPAPGRKQPTRIWAGAAALLVLFVVVFWMSFGRQEPLPQFGEIEDVTELKRSFFAFLAPHVQAVNRQTLADRNRLLALTDQIRDGERPGWLDRRWLNQLAASYDVEVGEDGSAVYEPGAALDTLILRVDRVPAPLALVQAAAESGWGRSRFAVEANNLFGHWCYETGCGLVPENRPDGARHEVAAFDSVRQSVARYMYNLNTHPAYRPFRERRLEAEHDSALEESMELTDGLLKYSQRREDYVDELKLLLRSNDELIQQVIASRG